MFMISTTKPSSTSSIHNRQRLFFVSAKAMLWCHLSHEQTVLLFLHMIRDADDVLQTSVSAYGTTRKGKAETIQPACVHELEQLSLQSKGTLETRHSFQKRTQGVHTTTKLKKGYQQARSDHKDLPHLLSASVSSHHNPLLSCHSTSTVREGTSCSDSRPLSSITPLPGLMHFPAQRVQGHVATQRHL